VKKQAITLFLILSLLTPYSQITLAQTDNYFEQTNGLTIKYYKDAAGYDQLLKPDGSVLVYSQRYTIEYLSGKQWKQITIPYTVTQNQEQVTRKYTNYLGTTAEVRYHQKDYGIKSDVVINSSETRNYRIVWSLDGIVNEDVRYGDNFVEFYNGDEWLRVDWNDAYAEYGDITDYTISESANGKKLDVTFNIGTVEAGETYTLDPHIYFEQAPEDSATLVDDDHWAAQTFTTTNGFNITIIELDMYRKESPGNLTVGIRKTDGSGHPMGSDIVTGNYNASGITSNTLGSPYNITVDSTALNASTKYAIVMRALNANISSSYVGIKYKSGGAFANGNLETSVNSGVNWTAAANDDMTFTVYGNAYPSIDTLDADTTFSRDTPGWLNFTISDPDGVADFTTYTIQVNTTGDVNNFTLRWTQATNSFSEVSDPDNICSLNGESVRTNINATHDLISFNFNITDGQSGLCDVACILIDDDGFIDTLLYTNAFTFSYFNWVNAVYDYINSAFNQFGIVNYMQQITVFITGLSAWFTTSLTRIITLLTLQFTVINAVFGWFIYWSGEMIDIVLQFSTYYHEFLDGTSAWSDALVPWWEFFMGFSDAFPLFGFIWWIGSLGPRGRQTVGGALQVIINDMNTAISLFSYFFGVFSFVANTIIDRVYGLFDALP